MREALCTLANGYVGTRGAAPEAGADDVHYPGTYLAGCYNQLSSTVAGRTVGSEDMVNVPNWLPLTFCHPGGDWFDVSRVSLLSYVQQLDLRRGMLTRLLRCEDEVGRRTRVAQRRLVSMDEPHLAALETTVTPENWSGRLDVRSALDGRVRNAGVARYRELSGQHLRPLATGFLAPESPATAAADGDDTGPGPEVGGPEVAWLAVQTRSSGIEIALAVRTRLLTQTGVAGRARRQEEGWVADELTVDAVENSPVTIEKVVAIYTSRDRAVSTSTDAASSHVSRADGFDVLVQRQVLAWNWLWRRSHVNVGGGEPQRVLNLHTFHLLQTLSPHAAELDVGVPARGLHGEAYRGHVFWDEVYVFPFLTLHLPEVTAALLRYRWRRLPAARWAARRAGHVGAMFPWQSASDGSDQTQELHLNPRSGRWLPDYSHLQRHVGLAVAYNVWQHYQATGDLDFFADCGAQLLLEIARFFASFSQYDRTSDRYEIRGVVGPDEYHDAYPGRDTPGIDNNAYTNIMAVWVLRRALDTLDMLPGDRRAELTERMALGPGEIDRFEDITRKMRVVFHSDGVMSQFEGYADLAELDWEGYRRRYGDIRRLDRILEAEGDSVNHYQASKQADVLLLFYFFSSAELVEMLTGLGYDFDSDSIPKTIEYYLARTSHGSTLSAVVHSWVLARSDRTRSWRFFQEALRSDIADVQGGTTTEGIHLGAMAGTVDLVQRCYTGMETRGGVLRFNPRLPEELSELELGLRYRGHWDIRVRCRADRIRVRMPGSRAAPIQVVVKDHTAAVEPGGAWETFLLCPFRTGSGDFPAGRGRVWLRNR